LFFAFFSIQAVIAQNTTVTGKVTDDKGAALEGAVVSEKNVSKNRTLTDPNGNYRISVKSGAVLQVSSVGFEKKEAASQAVTNFTLKSLKEDLSEVVVTALGIKKEKKALGYAVSSIGKKEYGVAKCFPQHITVPLLINALSEAMLPLCVLL
jgi:hypothetical protein